MLNILSQPSFLILDIGTGNVRVALTSSAGKILAVERDDVHYRRDERYPEALYFNPDQLWDQINQLARDVLKQVSDAGIQAITASSQREGIVLLDKQGNSLIGLPNHDHRGREWEQMVKNKDRVYELTGRYPASLFSALKLKGVEQRRSDLWGKTDSFLSISDWAQYKLSGVARYEYSQASETQLFDVAAKKWSNELAAAFDLRLDFMPKPVAAGSILGRVLPGVAASWDVPEDTPIVVGGADTQLAIKSTRPEVGDVAIVSGTTTPITKVLSGYSTDDEQRTWTNCDIEEGRFILETNAGVTGLNYQRLKGIFYPNESYRVMEQEMAEIKDAQCIASLGSLLAEERQPLVRGGFVFDVPILHQLSRSDFAWATLWDIACCIKENYETLCRVSPHKSDFVWGCSGGMQSAALRKFVAGLIDKPIYVRQGYRQASVAGCARLCQEALPMEGVANLEEEVEKTEPQDIVRYAELYEQWKDAREAWKTF